jgi:hypothetical protein
MAAKEVDPKLKREPSQEDPEAVSSEEEGRESRLKSALRGLIDALDRCSGDPPDCPHCGPARSLALQLLGEEQVQEAERSAEQERVSLSGRVGSDPTFRTTPKGTLVGRFPLAVHGEDSSTTWYPVLAFNQRAERLRDSVHKGEAVRVVGYVHERETRTRAGDTRKIQEIYAVTITSRSMR